jgi:hypothetical protein
MHQISVNPYKSGKNLLDQAKRDFGNSLLKGRKKCGEGYATVGRSNFHMTKTI